MKADLLRFVLGLKLKRLRLEQGASLREIAGRSGVSISYLSEIEKGKKYPKPERLLELARALGVSYDELVSLRVSEELVPLKEVFGSDFVREFPFELFGVALEDLLALATDAPDKAGALVRTFLEVGRTYDVQVEHFLFAALRSYQAMNHNYFEEIERAAEEFRAERGWPGGEPLSPELLRGVLEQDHGYRVDETTLAGHPDLGGLRSVFSAGRPPTLHINGRLLPAQKAFILGRELGHLRLGLDERAVTSSWLQVESFQQVLNNFKASYFSGSLLIDGRTLCSDLEALFARPRWEAEAFVACMRRFGATPEMFFYRLTELAPRFFSLEELYFLRFASAGGERFQLTKVFNLSRVPVPHGLGLDEHYCRRWPALELLGHPAGAGSSRGLPQVAVQRSYFLDEGAEFLVFSMARPLALADGVHSAVSLGLLLDARCKRRVRFWDDPAIPRREVNLTCERCRLEPEECAERAAEPHLYRQQQALRRKEKALARLLARPSHQ